MIYSCLIKNSYKTREFFGYELSPLLKKDMEYIRRWRNEQTDILRQNTNISPEEQEDYFNNFIKPTYSQEKPDQILFRFAMKEILIGYGGLTNIDWNAKRAEVSFLLSPIKQKAVYKKNFTFFLRTLKIIAFEDLKLNKIFTETYGIRLEHIKVLEDEGFILEGILRQHNYINDKYVNSLIHSILMEDYYV